MSSMNLPKTIDTAFEELYAASHNSRQRESLERVKAACDYLTQSGIKVTPTTINNYCVDRGWEGPRAQSIRNSKDVLLKYVMLRQAGQTLPVSKRNIEQEPVIKDESLKAYVLLLQQERDQAYASLSRVQAGLRKVPGIDVDSLIRVGFGGQKKEPEPPAANVLSQALVNALRALFDTQALHACGLELYKERIRQSATKNVLLEKLHVLAIQTALESVEVDSSAKRNKRWQPPETIEIFGSKDKGLSLEGDS